MKCGNPPAACWFQDEGDATCLTDFQAAFSKQQQAGGGVGDRQVVVAVHH
jgi:hypothetical protein